MAEFIQALCELLVLLLQLLFWMIRGSITILAYAASPRYRLKKRQEWANKPANKYFELGISGACLGALIALTLWLCWQAQTRKGGREAIRARERQHIVDVRLKINGATNDLTISVRKGESK